MIFFCLSAAVCWFIAYKDIKISSLLTLLFEVASVACILALACVILFKHGFPIDTAQLKVQGMTLHDLSLAVVITVFSLVGFESATTLGGEARKPLQQHPEGGDRQPAHHRRLHGLHELRRGLRRRPRPR